MTGPERTVVDVREVESAVGTTKVFHVELTLACGHRVNARNRLGERRDRVPCPYCAEKK